MFKRILLASDGPPDAGRESVYARDLALRNDAQVVVVHAFDPVPSYLGDPCLGSVSHRVLGHARIPVMKVKGPGGKDWLKAMKPARKTFQRNGRNADDSKELS
jgi:nucleotide-binding universal stress UspA family protein